MSSVIKLASLQPNFVLRALLGGAAVGGGAGLLRALLRQRQAILEPEENEEDEMVIPTVNPSPKTKKAGDTAATLISALQAPGAVINALGGLVPKSSPDSSTASAPSTEGPAGIWDYLGAGVGIPLGALAAYAGVNHLYQGWAKKDVQNRLRDEQEAFLAAAAAEAQQHKHASVDGARRAPDGMDWGLMAVLGALGLTGIASGVFTDRILEQQFPTTAKPKGGFRIGQIRDQEEEQEGLKTASEFMLHLGMQLEQDQPVGLENLVKAAGAGAIKDVLRTAVERGTDEALAYAEKVAQSVTSEEWSTLAKHASVRLVANSALAPVANILAATIVDNVSPGLRKSGAELREVLADHMPHFEALAGTLTKLALLAAAGTPKEETMPEANQEAADLLVQLQTGGSDKNDTLLSASAASEHSSEQQAEQADVRTDTAPDKDAVDNLLS